jgi:dTDP-4-dehydrorhamnose 3,5-epimerase
VWQDWAVLPTGVGLSRLAPHRDARGTFTELFRSSWELDVEPVQWNVVHSDAHVLRGVHAHHRHSDYLTVVAGRATIGLHDLRAGSPTRGLCAVVELDSDAPTGLTIPPGVAHGFYLQVPSIHVYAVSHEWDPADELGCHWNDPGLGIEWPCVDPLLSPRDAALGSLDELSAAVNAKLARA